ncbi:MAG: hypothetical protein QXF17_01455 [Ignisphaera sp.]
MNNKHKREHEREQQDLADPLADDKSTLMAAVKWAKDMGYDFDFDYGYGYDYDSLEDFFKRNNNKIYEYVDNFIELKVYTNSFLLRSGNMLYYYDRSTKKTIVLVFYLQDDILDAISSELCCRILSIEELIEFCKREQFLKSYRIVQDENANTANSEEYYYVNIVDMINLTSSNPALRTIGAENGEPVHIIIIGDNKILCYETVNAYITIYYKKGKVIYDDLYNRRRVTLYVKDNDEILNELNAYLRSTDTLQLQDLIDFMKSKHILSSVLDY